MATKQRVEVLPGVFITRDGVVYRSTPDDGEMLVEPCMIDGYPTVSIKIQGKRTTRSVHKLLMLAYGPPMPSPRHVVRHRNGDRSDYSLTNLVWGTHAENNADTVRMNRTPTFRKRGRHRAVQVYVSEAELGRLVTAARHAGVPLSTWMRDRCLA